VPWASMDLNISISIEWHFLSYLRIISCTYSSRKKKNKTKRILQIRNKLCRRNSKIPRASIPKAFKIENNKEREREEDNF